MSEFTDQHYFPRATSSESVRSLVALRGTSPRGTPVEDLLDVPFDLKQAQFHPNATNRVDEDALLTWRVELNSWAQEEKAFPSNLEPDNGKNNWDVDLGLRLIDDIGRIPEFLHPDVWCWIASHLLPHFVVYRWEWPKLKDQEVPVGTKSWNHFTAHPTNGLRMAINRILFYGEEIAREADSQEFQSLLGRPSFGSDPRVARVVMATFIEEWKDPKSNYGKHGGNRSIDNDIACTELRLINSLRPLCFESDETISEITKTVISELPELRAAR